MNIITNCFNKLCKEMFLSYRIFSDSYKMWKVAAFFTLCFLKLPVIKFRIERV